ncbi:hypothetical protein Sango_2155200 [Sesamum angolense]|uniref:Uncharacterized protein n=1 Tax=Sesamum angolense TaxID=2727404 RepID=A0AAE2BMM0_9LAMI|nr:hypothetical protein Sango_2155200 [Sesamum angolense]
MAAARGFTTPFSVRMLRRADVALLSGRNGVVLDVRRKKRRLLAAGDLVKCCCSEIRGVCGSGKNAQKGEERLFEHNKRPTYRGRVPVMPFASPHSRFVSKQEKFFSRCTPRSSGPQSRDSPLNEWWEKSDWTGYKELGVEKSGRNAEGDSWWETWREVLHQDEWSNLARIERSAQKQAKSGTENAGWYENWTDKWAETELGTKWGDKWEEKFFAGIGSRQGETWHVSPSGERWSRTWGEEHFGNGKVHKYGKSTTGESWDIVVDEETYYEAEPHYGWRMSLVIQHNYCRSSPKKDHLVFSQILILDHPHHLQESPLVLYDWF